jgi:hypothetical protein
MDLPVSIFDERSFREFLVQFLKNYFEDEVIVQGPAFLYPEGQQTPSQLFSPRDADMLASTPQQLARNFDTAAIGPERRMLIEAGRQYLKINDFENSMRYV